MQQGGLAYPGLSEHHEDGTVPGACMFHEGGKVRAFGLTAVQHHPTLPPTRVPVRASRHIDRGDTSTRAHRGLTEATPPDPKDPMTSSTVPWTPPSLPDQAHRHLAVRRRGRARRRRPVGGVGELDPDPPAGRLDRLVRVQGRQPVRAAKGLVLGAHHSFADVPPMQVLIHPGVKAPGS